MCSKVYDVLFMRFVLLMRLVPGIFDAYSYDRNILVVRCMKQNKDAVWSLVLLLGTGVRARTHMISYICT